MSQSRRHFLGHASALGAAPAELIQKTREYLAKARDLFLTGKHSQAVDQLTKVLQAQPDYALAHELMGLVYDQEGLADSAAEAFRKASDLSHGQYGLAALGHLYARSRRAEAQQVIGQLNAQRRRRYVSPYELAVVYAGLGEDDKAVDELDRAWRERSLSAQSFRCDPRLNGVRVRPR
jgi:Tfp pilus assembly protein PilF